MPPRFVQIHFLTPWPGVLLNRDDAGFAKRLRFGGAERTRVSSQCLKRHWRTFSGPGSLDELEAPDTIRSRETFQREIVEPLVKEGLDAAVVREVVSALRDFVLGKSEKAKATKKGEEERVLTGQVTVLGRPEIDHLKDLARQVARETPDPKKAEAAVKELLGREGLKNLQTMKMAGGLGAALFGRMVTSDILSRGDAAVHVAHAFTVHRAETETDYFSAVDDLVKDEGELGSGHIGNTELTSGLFYGYVVVDVPLLISNLTGVARSDWRKAEWSLAGQVVERLVRLVATVTPGAKLGSTAPYSAAHLVLVEAGDAQPRSLANAFLKPVDPKGDLLQATYKQLAAHVHDLDQVYEPDGERQLVALHASEGLADALHAQDAGSLRNLAAWAGGRIAESEAGPA